MNAFVLFGHGSSVQSANESVIAVGRQLAEAGHWVETAFLEQGRPDLAGAVNSLVERGATRIAVIPYFLTLGIHLQRDLPGIVQNLAKQHSGVEIRVAPPLDGHPALLRIVLDRAAEFA